MTRPRPALAILAAAALALSGCATTAEEDPARSEPLVVFAAASLQGTFDELAEAFVAEHPEYSVDPIRYDGSQALATQIIDGADVDVVAFANESSLEPVTAAGRTDAGDVFATNTLRIAVAPGNPKGIADLPDLADPDLAVVLCAPEVPCGEAARTLLSNAGVPVTAVSEETSVTGVTTRVAGGEADAGLVYATDIAGSGGELEGIVPSGADAVVNRYPIAVAEDARSPVAAQAFVDFVLSDDGQRILAQAGFGTP
ncbi:molybdate ABC transporter substrate-binding protein [Microbacterium sp. CIAB417]|uniref:molybdate ABC transporter substrate-binding protein n=1 Tax=Microbacterium sp. CIAB417 TaxID=2860287 RepID=UPI001FADF5AC|nr:molybdate ABC transporter substrate-binding protein [Microbacterium sp. CIAB417]